MRQTLARLGIALLALLGIAAGGGFAALRSSLPETEGRVPVAGPDAAVEVLRDAAGVPYIFARSENDAYFALGFVHAQDRLWQMEAGRRLARGRLSEVFGERTLGADRLFRTLGLAGVAGRNLAALDAETQAALAAYAAGVNAYLAARSGLLPPEFLISGAPEPEPWEPVDSLLVIKLMAWRLAGNRREEALRARLAERLEPTRIADLWPPSPSAPVVVPADAAALAPLFEAPPVGTSGSNAWAIAGTRTSSGRPLLANDTHLWLDAPGPFYLARLSAPGLDVAGATLPGLPFVVIGHNQWIAWGFANGYGDVQDLFVETDDPADPDRYLAPGGSRPYAVRDETIRIAGGGVTTLRVRESRHGPIVSGLLAAAPPGKRIALAWTALADDDTTADAGRRLALARDWPGFIAALNAFQGPQQAVVYADTAGDIGVAVPGRVPLRRNGDGLAPVDGASGEYDWVGWIPEDALPRARNPAAGQVIAANQRLVGDDYPYPIARHWPPGYRAERIGALLAARDDHDAGSLWAMQADVVSLQARELLPRLRALAPAEPLAEKARALIGGWDGTMAAERPEPLIYAAWYRALTRRLYADELGPLFAAAWRPRPRFVARALAGAGGWCDDVTTGAIETCDDLVAAAFAEAVAGLANRFGDDPAEWRWGDAHWAESRHPVLAHVPLLGPLASLRRNAGGDAFTIDATAYAIGGAGFVARHGPVFRAVYDLADLARSRFLLSTGQSGNPLSPHYGDLAAAWQRGEWLTIATDRAALAAARRLVLVPK